MDNTVYTMPAFLARSCWLALMNMSCPQASRGTGSDIVRQRSDSSYIAQLTRWPDQRAVQSRKWQLIGKSQWCCSANCGHHIARVNVQLDPVMQLANTPPLQSTTPGLHPVNIHQTSPLVRGSKHPITAYYSVYRPRKDERVSRPGWLVTYRNKVPPPEVEPGHVTHPSSNRARRRVTSMHTVQHLHSTNSDSGVTRGWMARGSHSFTCHPHVYQRREWAIVYAFRKHSPDSVAPARWRTSGSVYYSSIDPERMKGWVGLVGWPYSGWFTRISGHPSATGRAWDMESSPVKDWRSTAVPRSRMAPLPVKMPTHQPNRSYMRPPLLQIFSFFKEVSMCAGMAERRSVHKK